jgi:hypothetical protein
MDITIDPSLLVKYTFIVMISALLFKIVLAFFFAIIFGIFALIVPSSKRFWKSILHTKERYMRW